MDTHDIDLMVSDVHDCGAWNLQNLYTQLPQHVFQKIRELDFNLNPQIDDKKGTRYSY